MKTTDCFWYLSTSVADPNKERYRSLLIMKLTAACLLLLSCGLSFGANISFRGIAEGSHTYSPISGSTNSSGGGQATNVMSSLVVNVNQITTNGGVISIITGADLTNAVMFGTWSLEGTFYMGDVLASSSILRSDIDGDLSTVTIGSGLSFDGSTLSASGASQTPWSSDINGAGFSLTNGNRAQFQVVYFNTNRNSYVSNDFINGRTYHYVSNVLAFVESYHGPTGSGLGVSTNDSQFYSLNVGSGFLGSAAFAGGSVLIDNSGNIILGTNTAGNTIISNSAGVFSLQTSNSIASKLYQTTTGVGIGTNTPMATLHLQHQGSNAVFAISGITNATPANAVTVSAWIPMNLNGTNGFIPFYQ